MDVLQSTVTETVVSKQVVVVDFHSIKIMSCGLAGDAPFKVSFIYVGVSTVRRELGCLGTPLRPGTLVLATVLRTRNCIIILYG